MRPLCRFLALLLPILFSLPASAQVSPSSSCVYNPDYNCDLTIGTADLLSILNLWSETDSDADGVWDSMDDCIGTYDACGVCNGAGSDVDFDGVCDNIDPCVGALDVCGVCNGPGPSIPMIDEIVFVTDSIYVPPIQQWYVFSYAVDTLYTYVCPVQGCTDANAANFNPLAVIEDGSCSYGPAQCGGASTITFDGHTYALVAIGTQCWFKENLRSDNYRNGDAIPGNLTDSQWTSTSSGAQTVYGEGTSYVYQGSSDEVANLTMYGRLYNCYAVNDARGLCPVGFHVPSDTEWMTLEMALGMSSAQANGTGWRGTDQGSQLKASSNDSPPWNGTNTSGFSALPGGSRASGGGEFGYLGGGLWWSSSSSGSTAWFRHTNSENSSFYRNYDVNIRFGFSVRCIRDEGVVCLDPDNDGVCAENEVSGCTDSNATNFNPSATEDDGTCVLPGPAQCGGASTVTFDGHTYALVGIGTQCWFKENLRSDNYRNGDAIPGNLTDSQWTSTSSGAQTVYGEGTSAVYDGSSDEVANLAIYGRLYNWYAVNDARGLCPVGFHVPSDSEWMTLEMALGMTSGQANGTGYRGTDQGTQLKASSSDSPPWNGTNSSGFSALPGGIRYNGNGYLFYLGDRGHWWSSSPSGSSAWYRYLHSGVSEVIRSDYNYNVRAGLSVRCVRDVGLCLDADNDGVCAENEINGCTDSNATNFNPTATEEDGSCVLPGLAHCGGDSTVTFDGHTYALVAIGTQCWFKENLRSDNYRNGDAIPGNLTDSQWTSTGSGAQAVYNNDPANLATYGRLYNWYAVTDARGLCPVGFHLPTDNEWTALENALGGSSVAGTALKSSAADSPPWDGANSSGFSALPGGYRSYAGSFFDLGYSGPCWSSSPSGSSAWFRSLYSGNSNVNRANDYVRFGFSVRCVRD
jgi:uncharacterized protein (TIGR02145 family)